MKSLTHGQGRLWSLIEAAANIFVGYFVAVMMNFLVLPLFHLSVNLTQSMKIGLIFTVAALFRSYLMRRLFNWIHTKGARSVAQPPS